MCKTKLQEIKNFEFLVTNKKPNGGEGGVYFYSPLPPSGTELKVEKDMSGYQKTCVPITKNLGNFFVKDKQYWCLEYFSYFSYFPSGKQIPPNKQDKFLKSDSLGHLMSNDKKILCLVKYYVQFKV